MDRQSTIGAQRSDVIFKLPLITFLRPMTCSASIKQNLGSIQHHSHQNDAQGTVVRLSKVCTQRFRPIFSDLEFRLCSSNTLQVGVFFGDNFCSQTENQAKPS